MEQSKIRKLAGALELLVGAALLVNLLVVLMTPAFVWTDPDHFLNGAWKMIERQIYPNEDDIAAAGWCGLFCGWLFVLPGTWVWEELNKVLLSLFFGGCGICTAVMLRQAGRVLDSIRQGQPFRMSNAKAVWKAAVCCWVIAGLALGRCLLGLYQLGDPSPLFTRNALFIPIFFMGGLLCMVMSALFRRAAELREDQDLTI